MLLPSAATNAGPEGGEADLWGRTLTAAPVSTRKSMPVVSSFKKTMPPNEWRPAGRPASFPKNTSRGRCSCSSCRRTCDDCGTRSCRGRGRGVGCSDGDAAAAAVGGRVTARTCWVRKGERRRRCPLPPRWTDCSEHPTACLRVQPSHRRCRGRRRPGGPGGTAGLGLGLPPRTLAASRRRF